MAETHMTLTTDIKALADALKDLRDDIQHRIDDGVRFNLETVFALESAERALALLPDIQRRVEEMGWRPIAEAVVGEQIVIWDHGLVVAKCATDGIPYSGDWDYAHKSARYFCIPQPPQTSEASDE